MKPAEDVSSKRDACIAVVRATADLFLRRLRLAVFVILDTAVLLVPPKRRNTALIIRLDALGDFCLWLQTGAPAVIDAASRDGTTKVIVAANSVWARFAVELRCFDAVVAINVPWFMRKPIYRFRVLAQLRRLGAQTVLQPRSAKVFLQEDEIVRVCGAEERIGSECVLTNITPRLARYASSFYTRIVDVPRLADTHESRRNIAFALALSPGADARDLYRLPYSFPLERLAPSFQGDYVVVAPGAGWSGRQWPIASLAPVIRSLNLTYGLRCVVVGAPSDAHLAADLIHRLPGIVMDYVGRSSVMETAHIMAGSKLVISNESGPLHLAIWVGAPVVAVMGGGHFGRFAPYPETLKTKAPVNYVSRPMPCFGCNWQCIFPRRSEDAVKCISDIGAEKVLEAAVQLLSTGSTTVPYRHDNSASVAGGLPPSGCSPNL